MSVIFFNLVNLYFMYYFFMLATVSLIMHDTIKKATNKDIEKPEDKITDFNIYIMGGVFAYFCIYFARSFYYKIFFGYSLV